MSHFNSHEEAYPIGVFDSGSGGLSILQSLRELLPHESYIYMGDHANNPYGNKSTEFIRERTVRAIKFFLNTKAKLIVVACNTATIAGIDWYREKFPDIPIVGVVPVIKTAAQMSKTKHFIVLSTEYTAKSEYQKKLIDEFGKGCRVISLGSSTLVPLIENGLIDDESVKIELEKVLTGYTSGVDDILVLGCTHYPFLKPILRAMIGTDIQILDSGGAVARQVHRILSERKDMSQAEKGEISYYTTGNAKHVQTIFSTLLNHEVTVKHIVV